LGAGSEKGSSRGSSLDPYAVSRGLDPVSKNLLGNNLSPSSGGSSSCVGAVDGSKLSIKSTFNKNSSALAKQKLRSQHFSGNTKSGLQQTSSPVCELLTNGHLDKSKLPSLGNKLSNPSDTSNTSGNQEENQQIVDGFMDSARASEQQQQYIRMESTCLLKTKTDNFKTHWAVLDGNEIYCFRH